MVSNRNSERAPRRQDRKRFLAVSAGQARAHIHSSFNNTIVSISDEKGNTILWSSAGSCGFKGTKKGTPYAAQIATEKVAKKAVELGIRDIAVYVTGPGPGREVAIRTLQAVGLRVSAIKDVTPLPHNGCRPPKARRV
ncbi:MAG: 30S ribosomal protein S11 [Elusimicrobia bacterium]|nr:30S ribosomal protein S11 [Elusimicrobiota bacterium]